MSEAPKFKVPRKTTEIQAEYGNICNRCGDLSYRIFAMEKDLHILYDRARDLNLEHAAAMQAEAESAAAAKAEAAEAVEAETKGEASADLPF